ncbi:MAG: PDZ domain-containing protein [Phycisphaerales bacterium]
MDKGLFGSGTSLPEATPSFDEWLKSEEGRKAAEAATDKGTVRDDGSSPTIEGVFEEPSPAAGGVTLDDFVRVNQGVSDPDEFSRQLVIPPGLEAQEPWVTQWQVYNVLVDFPEGGRAGLYVDAVRCGQANPSPGRRGILYLHPRSIEESAGLTCSVTLNGASPVLRLGVCGNRNPDGDWVLVVNVDGARLGAERLIRGSDGWQDLAYDLSGFSTGEPILICIETRANDWQHEYAFIDYIQVEDDGGVVPQAEPVAARVVRAVVEDNFDSENGGTGRIGYEGFENWYVRGGDVDLVGRGLRDTHPNHGLYVDMDGGGYTAGTLQSKGAYRLGPGLYRLQFDLAGDPERTRNTMTVSLGKLYSESFTLEAKEPFQTISREIPVVKTVNASLVFKQAGRDRGGFLLDNVSLAVVSYPDAGFLPVRRTAYLGVRVTKHVGVGFAVVDVTAAGPAELAGLQKGDLILLVDGGTLADADLGESQFAEMVSSLPYDQPVRLTIQRDGKLLDIWVRPKPKE